MTNSQKMDKESNKLMERILNLTLEIIYLMTGEDYILVKKTACEYMTPSSHPCMSGRCSRSEHRIMEPLPQSLIPKITNDAKILEVTQKIIELLTGEVPIRCQEVTVYFSMEEWEYIEGHKDLYKDAMMENRPPLTSPDESSNGNPPETCPHPLYSQNSTQEHQEIPQGDQEIPQGDQEIPQEDQEILQEDQCENLFDVKVEVKEEAEESCKEEETLPEISTDGQHNSSNWEKDPVISVDGLTEDDDIKYGSSDDDDITSESFEETPNFHPVFPSADPLSNPSTCGWDIPSHSPPTTYHGTTFPCSEGGECFTQEEDLTLHQGSHQGEKPYSCHECGKCFTRKRNLISHLNSHTGDNQFSCAECGKCFPQRARLFIHQRTHTGVKPYSCSECGKCFIQRVRLRSHERTHTGMKPFFCAECGKCFAERSNLNAHQSCHAGVKPYSCSACGKSFHQRRYLISHERTHTGEKPFSCTECGRCFADRSTLARHQRTHSGEKPFSCAVCGKRFTQKSNLITHEKVHTGEKPYSCSECGKCFSRKSYLISHEKTHRGAKS